MDSVQDTLRAAEDHTDRTKQTHYPGKACQAPIELQGDHHANMPNHGGVRDWVLDVLKLHPYSDHAFDSPE